MKILVTGGTGFIGRQLMTSLLELGHELMVLTRKPESARRKLPEGVFVTADLASIPGNEVIDAIVNLAGEGIADRRWSSKRKQAIFDSRIQTTQAIGELVRRLDAKPGVIISGSAIGFYGDAGDLEVTEMTPAVRRDFTYLLCDAWEAAAREAAGDVRLCILRTGVVLGRSGGMLARLLPLYRVGLGAQLGDGSQWVSWIHIRDMVALILFCLGNVQATGVYNAVAPEPVRHSDFHKALSRTCHRPGLLRVPALPLRLLLGEMSVLLLGGQRVLPIRLTEQGFRFHYATLDDALADCVAEGQATRG